MLICLLFSACGVQNVEPDVNLPSTPYPVTPTPTLEPTISQSVAPSPTQTIAPSPTASVECVCRYGNVKSVQYNPINGSEEMMDVPILVKDCNGRSLVVAWEKDAFTLDSAKSAVVMYLGTQSKYLAPDWIYSVLNVEDPGAVHIYVTDEELAELREWGDLDKVVNYVDVLESQAYKNHGTLTLNVWHCGDDFEPVTLPQ